VDHRTRRDRTEQRNKAFDAQMPVLVDAYMDWTVQNADRDNPLPDPTPSPNDGEYSVRVINLFGKYNLFITLFYLLMDYFYSYWEQEGQDIPRRSEDNSRFSTGAPGSYAMLPPRSICCNSSRRPGAVSSRKFTLATPFYPGLCQDFMRFARGKSTMF
jgi:hypothetical protein